MCCCFIDYTTDTLNHWHTTFLAYLLYYVIILLQIKVKLIKCSFVFEWREMQCQIQTSCATLWIVIRKCFGILNEKCHKFFFCAFASLCEKFTFTVGMLFKLRNCNNIAFEEFCQHKHVFQLRKVLWEGKKLIYIYIYNFFFLFRKKLGADWR